MSSSANPIFKGLVILERLVLVEVVVGLVLIVVGRLEKAGVLRLLFDLAIVAVVALIVLVARLELVQVHLRSSDDGTEPLVRRD